VTRFELSRIMNTLMDHHNLCPKVYNHPIISNESYEYGWQESDKCPNGKMYYITFYDFLMVDIDDINLNISHLNDMMIELGFVGRLYRTYNGYHLFLTSHSFYHKSKETKEIMLLLGCDLFYITFSYLNGFKIRLNPKIRDEEYIAAEYHSIIGPYQNIPENTQLLHFLSIHDKYLQYHKS